MKIITFFLFLFFFNLIKTKPLLSWKRCYQEDTSPNITVTSAFSKLSFDKRVFIHLNATMNEPLFQGYYTFEIWHSETGDKISYNGPYDICCGFRVNSLCEMNLAKTDCPLTGNIEVVVSRPLHKNHYGIYEATLRIFSLEKEELLCIDLPFVNKNEDKKIENLQEKQLIIKDEIEPKM